MTAHGTAVAPGRRRSLGSMSVAVLVCAAAATLSTSASVGAVTGHAVTTQEAVVAPIISVTQVPAAISLGPCSGGAADLHYQTVNDAESFMLRIVAVTEPCTPIEAVAVVYRMPDGSLAWPQSLLERRELRIDRAGTVDVRFAKECVPLQFDVVTGSTPDTIAPWAQWHGPLLFDGDVGSSWQHRPAGNCAGPTSTVPPTTDSPRGPELDDPQLDLGAVDPDLRGRRRLVHHSEHGLGARSDDLGDAVDRPRGARHLRRAEWSHARRRARADGRRGQRVVRRWSGHPARRTRTGDAAPSSERQLSFRRTGPGSDGGP